MANERNINYDCWIVCYEDGHATIVSLKHHAFDALFVANAFSGRGMKQIVSVFRNVYVGEGRRRRH